ncbi:hypothetical protein MTO96_019782 [Rhipicephalus appendiculatus]
MFAHSAQTLVAFVACNTTDQCAVVEESATCVEHLCLCPSFEPLATGTRCNSTRSVFPLALGKNCTVSTDCSSTAACVEGQCRCPHGYQPSDEQDCSVIRQSEFVTSWFAFVILASSILLIFMLVLYLCFLGYRSRNPQWPFWRPAFAEPSATTIVVSGQASLCGGYPTASTLAAPAMTGETNGVVLESDHLTAGAAQNQEGHDSSHVTLLELSTQGVAPSMSELRGLGGTSQESFVRPVLSKEQVYAKYPHLVAISSPASQRSMSLSGRAGTTASEVASDEAKKTKKDGNTPTELSGKSCPRRSSRGGSSKPAVVVPTKEGNCKGPQAADADGCTGSDSVASEEQLSDFSVPWSSVDGSLGALLSVPVVARVHGSSSSATESSRKSARELNLPFDKLRD